MEGHGTYNRSSCVQATGSSSAVPLFEKAASQVQLTSAADPVVIADYGSSEGRNSLEPLTAAIGIPRYRGDHLARANSLNSQFDTMSPGLSRPVLLLAALGARHWPYHRWRTRFPDRRNKLTMR